MARAVERLHVTDLHVEDGIQHGRNAGESYQRFGALMRPEYWNDPLYQAAVAASGGRSIVEPVRMKNLYLLIRYFLGALPVQNVIEFGTYNGGSALFMAFLLKELHPGATIHALDTFAGMPETSAAVDLHRQGDFQKVDLDGLKKRAREFRLDNLIIVQGLIQDTFPQLPKETQFGLAHIDVDIYSAVKYCQDTVWERMTPGGYVAYDDANAGSCLGATQAMEEMIMERWVYSEQAWPHYVFRARL